jgi:hypothetical protein
LAPFFNRKHRKNIGKLDFARQHAPIVYQNRRIGIKGGLIRCLGRTGTTHVVNQAARLKGFVSAPSGLFQQNHTLNLNP